MMQEPILRFFIIFYDFLFENFVKINKLFQSEETIVDKKKHQMVGLFDNILKIFLKNEYIDNNLKDLEDIDVRDSSNFEELKNMGLSQRLYNFFANCKKDEKLNDDEIHSCLVNCRIILTESCVKLQQKFDFDQNWIPFLKISILKMPWIQIFTNHGACWK